MAKGQNTRGQKKDVQNTTQKTKYRATPNILFV
jgi:hypothetical protein